MRGAELEAEWSPTDRIALSAALTWARGRVLDDDSFAADVPARSAVLTVRHAFSEVLWGRLRARLVARDDEPGPTEIITPGYSVLDLSAGFDVSRTFEVVVSGSNLFDERYPVSADVDAPLAPGRSAAISLQARW